MKFYSIIFSFIIIFFGTSVYSQVAIPVPLENSKKISETNGEFDVDVIKAQKNIPEKYKDLVWNKWDTKNFIILSIDKNQGLIVKKDIENIKEYLISRWGISNFDFSVPCKVICVNTKDLLLDLFKINDIHCEVRRDKDNKISLSAIWLCFDNFNDISYCLSNVCFDEMEQIKNKQVPFFIKKGMCYLSKDVSTIKKELSEFGVENIDYNYLISKNQNDLDNDKLDSYEKQSAIVCLLFRKEFGQVNFINYLNNNDINNFGFDDVKKINDTLNRYYKNLLDDLKNDKVPGHYLNIRRK